MRSNSALRRCGSGREVAKLECVANPASHIAAHHFFCDCNLRTAIDFAEAAEGGVGGVERNGMPSVNGGCGGMVVGHVNCLEN
ncbi:MAG: hypothetical protein WA977_03815 [Halobacteriota archaeon]